MRLSRLARDSSTSFLVAWLSELQRTSRLLSQPDPPVSWEELKDLVLKCVRIFFCLEKRYHYVSDRNNNGEVSLTESFSALFTCLPGSEQSKLVVDIYQCDELPSLKKFSHCLSVYCNLCRSLVAGSDHQLLTTEVVESLLWLGDETCLNGSFEKIKPQEQLVDSILASEKMRQMALESVPAISRTMYGQLLGEKIRRLERSDPTRKEEVAQLVQLRQRLEQAGKRVHEDVTVSSDQEDDDCICILSPVKRARTDQSAPMVELLD